MSALPLLEVRGLTVSFPGQHGRLQALHGVEFSLARGEVIGIVGKSGSGKSLTMLAVMGLLAPGTRAAGSIRFNGEEILGKPERTLRRMRGGKIGMIFQDAMTALNPVITIGDQIAEAIGVHNPGMSRRAIHTRAVELLEQVAIPDPRRRAGQYPFEFSGGMRQRALIAMAVANEPELLIADEPTTALDVTIQAQMIELLQRLRRERGIGLVLITHDIGLVAGMADRVAIMYSGAHRRAGLDARTVPSSPPPLYPTTAGFAAAARQPGRAPLDHRGDATVADRPEGWLRLRAALPARSRPLPHQRSGDDTVR